MLLRIIPIFCASLLLGGCAANGEYARRNPPVGNVVADILREIGKGAKAVGESGNRNRSRIDVYHHSEE